MQKKIFLFVIVLVTILSGCKKDDPETAPETNLVDKDWNTDGVYVNNTKTIAPNVKVKFTKSTPINGISVNDQSLTGDRKSVV